MRYARRPYTIAILVAALIVESLLLVYLLLDRL